MKAKAKAKAKAKKDRGKNDYVCDNIGYVIKYITKCQKLTKVKLFKLLIRKFEKLIS